MGTQVTKYPCPTLRSLFAFEFAKCLSPLSAMYHWTDVPYIVEVCTGSWHFPGVRIQNGDGGVWSFCRNTDVLAPRVPSINHLTNERSPPEVPAQSMRATAYERGEGVLGPITGCSYLRPEEDVVPDDYDLWEVGEKGTWCSWLSRSLSISKVGLREGSGSIPDVSTFYSSPGNRGLPRELLVNVGALFSMGNRGGTERVVSFRG